MRGGALSAAQLRPAGPEDCGRLLELIRELAQYERLAAAVRADEDSLRATLFGPRPAAQVLLAELDGVVVGFALYFANYSTFLAQPGLWLEDLYVQAEHRGRGIGGMLFQAVAEQARAANCGRMEWSVLDWNSPAIAFYKRMGARPQQDWTTWRLTGTGLRALAERGR